MNWSRFLDKHWVGNNFKSYIELFKESEGFSQKIFSNENDIILQIRKGNNLLEIPAYKNVVFFNGQVVTLRTVIVYVDKNETFYQPGYLKDIFDKK
jgi:alkaline phosphatase